jgi:hypothetical protein
MNKSVSISINSNTSTLSNAATLTNNNAYQIQNVQNYIKELEISEGQLSSCIKYRNKKQKKRLNIEKFYFF